MTTATIITKTADHTPLSYISRIGGLDLHYEDVEINMCVLLYKALQGESTIYINDLLIANKSVHGKGERHGQYNFVCFRRMPNVSTHHRSGKAF